jgi:Domain of unknown function (DUF6285)
MIARAGTLAHAIELQAGEFAAAERSGLARVRGALIGDDPAAARRQLATDIRAGKFPAHSPEEVRLVDHLLDMVARRLRLTNPKYMVARQRSGRAESSI